MAQVLGVYKGMLVCRRARLGELIRAFEVKEIAPGHELPETRGEPGPSEEQCAALLSAILSSLTVFGTF